MPRPAAPSFHILPAAWTPASSPWPGKDASVRSTLRATDRTPPAYANSPLCSPSLPSTRGQPPDQEAHPVPTFPPESPTESDPQRVVRCAGCTHGTHPPSAVSPPSRDGSPHRAALHGRKARCWNRRRPGSCDRDERLGGASEFHKNTISHVAPHERRPVYLRFHSQRSIPTA